MGTGSPSPTSQGPTLRRASLEATWLLRLGILPNNRPVMTGRQVALPYLLVCSAVHDAPGRGGLNLQGLWSAGATVIIVTNVILGLTATASHDDHDGGDARAGDSQPAAPGYLPTLAIR